MLIEEAAPSKFSQFLVRRGDWIIFFVTTFVVSLLLSLTIHGIIGPAKYKEGQIAKTTVRSSRDILVEKDVGSVSQFAEIKRGEVIVRAGDRVTRDQAQKLILLKAESKATDPIRVWGGYFILTSVLLLSCYAFMRRYYFSFKPSNNDLVVLSVTLISSLVLIQLFSILGNSLSESFSYFEPDTFLLATPLSVGGMLLQVILGAPAVLLFVLVFSVLTGVFLESSWLFLVLIVSGNLIASFGVRRCTKRSVFLRASLKVALVNAVVVLSFLLLHGQFENEERIYRVLFVMLSGVLSGIISASFVPLAEFFGKYTTDMQLLELSSLDHPLLRELSIQAPGTWNHSMVVGQMAEAACEAIRANPLLARVGAYYHDVGKSKYPAYFIENQHGENRHDKLTPSMSALIIKAHVKDGIDMANEHRLPQVLKDMIQEHHGTSLIEFFYDKAKKESEEGEAVDESNFRYSGPKPQFKESAVLMLADAIEATSRTLPDSSPAKLQGLVQKTINRIFANGELDESGLTLKDLHLIAKYFVRVLNGIYHKRIEYPDAPTKEKKSKTETSSSQSNGKSKDSEIKQQEIKPSGDSPEGQGEKGPTSSDKEESAEESGGDTLRRLGIQK
jgi:putative nucleotidyltransferase with HDIG domain